MISSMYELQTNSLIGEGVYGRIFAIKKPLMKHVAVKIPNGAIYAASLWNEAKILISLQKQEGFKEKYIVTCLGKFPCIYGGYVTSGVVFELHDVNLHQYVASLGRTLPLEHIRTIGLQVLKALIFLRDNKVIHGDLKPENILLSRLGTKQERLVIADFGCAILEGSSHGVLQSMWYRSPEMVAKKRATVAIDTWSFGCILMELHCGNAFACEKEFQLRDLHQGVLSRKYLVQWGLEDRPIQSMYRLASHILFSPPLSRGERPLLDLLKRVFVFDPSCRIKPDKIKKHKFFAGDWWV